MTFFGVYTQMKRLRFNSVLFAIVILSLLVACRPTIDLNVKTRVIDDSYLEIDKDIATNVVYLSGRGKDDTVDWEFFCTEGKNSGVWTTILVPSNWELQGFGGYDYGHVDEKSCEKG